MFERFKKIMIGVSAIYLMGGIQYFFSFFWAFPHPPSGLSSWAKHIIIGPPVAFLVTISGEWVGGKVFSKNMERKISVKPFSPLRLLYIFLYLLILLGTGMFIAHLLGSPVLNL